MTTSEKQRKQQAELHKKLWAMANDLRGQMEANEFKSYILGLVFYRFLSEKVETTMARDLEANESFEDLWKDEESRKMVKEELVNENGYAIPPNLLFSALIAEIEKGENGKFDTEMLQDAINEITRSTIGEESQQDFEHLFEDMDLTSSKLGNDVPSRSRIIAKIMLSVNEIPFLHDDVDIDVLGDAYEYLIGQFAANAGSKAGEFYSPQQVSKVLSKIVADGKTEIKSVYDPTAGSGSLLLRVAREVKVGKFFGQELTATTYNLARMNMLLHDVPYQNFDIQNGNTLTNPKHLGRKFSAIVANPPYSAKWSADPKFLNDERFSEYGKLAPKSKADFAFVQHMIHHLDKEGTMAVVLPHGVLFRGAAEGVIRKYLVEDKNYLDAVIGLPANLFFGTPIATCILVFKKNRKKEDNILFIDASNEFERGKNQNQLTNENVQKITETYSERKEIERYSHRATLEEIRENEFNLNIPRYVDTFIEEAPLDIDEAQARIKELEANINEKKLKIANYLKELGITQ